MAFLVCKWVAINFSNFRHWALAMHGLHLLVEFVGHHLATKVFVGTFASYQRGVGELR